MMKAIVHLKYYWLIQTGLRSTGNVLKPLAIRVLIPLGLTAAASATDATFHKKIFGSGFTKLKISNCKMEDIMKIVRCLEDSGLLKNGVSGTIKNEAKKRKGEFLGMLLGALGATLLQNLLTDKAIITISKGTIIAGEIFNAASFFN